ncbi:MAG: hypothetical protein NC347_08445 [Clostridium sp.]|nr:hypothetical protein [Clostridium sp.]
MRTVKVCVYDEEENYARQLSSLLNRKGEGRFRVTAVTNIDSLWEYMGTRQIDILLAANWELLCQVRQWKRDIYILWLREEEPYPAVSREIPAAASISRYAGVRRIYQMVEGAAAQLSKVTECGALTAAVYSPVGRCGKTRFALEVVRESDGKWVYIGMEDYGCIWQPDMEDNPAKRGDTFLYFVKERKKENLYQVIEECNGIVPSAFSPFDSKSLNGQDWEWLMDAMRAYRGCGGVLFDVGTGILQEPAWLFLFDVILVPYLQDKQSLGKKEKFEMFIEAYGLLEIKEKLRFVDMGNEEEIRERKKELEYPGT